MEDAAMVDTLPQAKQRNAVSFVDRPKLSKTKSLRPVKKESSPVASGGVKIKLNLGNAMDEDDDFARAESDDSEDDYDGVPRTEEIPLLPGVMPLDRDKMEITLERHSSSSAQEMLDVPIT